MDENERLAIQFLIAYNTSSLIYLIHNKNCPFFGPVAEKNMKSCINQKGPKRGIWG